MTTSPRPEPQGIPRHRRKRRAKGSKTRQCPPRLSHNLRLRMAVHQAGHAVAHLYYALGTPERITIALILPQ